MAWNLAESPKVTTIIGKAGLKQGANVKNAKAFKSFRTDICRLDLFKLHHELVKKLDPHSHLLKMTYLECKSECT